MPWFILRGLQTRWVDKTTIVSVNAYLLTYDTHSGIALWCRGMNAATGHWQYSISSPTDHPSAVARPGSLTVEHGTCISSNAHKSASTAKDDALRRTWGGLAVPAVPSPSPSRGPAAWRRDALLYRRPVDTKPRPLSTNPITLMFSDHLSLSFHSTVYAAL